MKHILTAAFTFIVASTLFIGCGFVDDNSAAVTYDEEPAIESTYSGYYPAKVDTTGYEKPG